MSTPSNPETPEQPGAPKRPWWKTPKGIAGIVAALVVVGIIGSCNDDTDNTPADEETTTQTTVVEDTTTQQAAPDPTTPEAPSETTPEEETVTAGQDKATEYEAWLKEQFGVDSFTEVLMQDSTLWAGYINGIEADGDRMHVRLQVDRTTPDGQALGERAAKAIASLIRLGDDPRVNDVDWVVVEDGAGTYISQESV